MLSASRKKVRLANVENEPVRHRFARLCIRMGGNIASASELNDDVERAFFLRTYQKRKKRIVGRSKRKCENSEFRSPIRAKFKPKSRVT